MLGRLRARPIADVATNGGYTGLRQAPERGAEIRQNRGDCSRSVERIILASPFECVKKPAHETQGAATVRQISIFVLGLVTACASAPAPAQDLTAGKTPEQLFRSDCAECHRLPSSVARTRDSRGLADFLREHYTTKPETAGALAAYVSSFAPGAAAVHNHGTDATPPEARRRKRGEGEATATGGDAQPKVRPVEERALHHRRTTRPSGDGEKRKADDDGEAPRPPAGIAATPASSKSNGRTRSGEVQDAIEPNSRLRSQLPPGGRSEGGNLEAAKTGAPKPRKRRNRANAEPPAPDAQAEPKANADVPATIGPTGPGTQRKDDVPAH